MDCAVFEGSVLLVQFENVPAACRFPGPDGELQQTYNTIMYIYDVSLSSS
jgi:hypothetical protein